MIDLLFKTGVTVAGVGTIGGVLFLATTIPEGYLLPAGLTILVLSGLSFAVVSLLIQLWRDF